MRFIADGPAIPDDLLTARDQGRVIFFCGAGVSRARANLPDFFGLAERVIESLGVEQTSPIRRLISEAKEIDKRVGVSGVISADRIFGLLEREFSAHDIVEAVAQALKPSLGCDLSAHRILIELATTNENAVRVVTTNFDRLFDECGVNHTWQQPRLPNPLRPQEMDGIVYLHGRANSDYTGAEGEGFILSSSEFGRAYLSDGWATSFIRDILKNFVVVFVGYSADDPPVQYLLEALRNASSELGAAYAFQSGSQEDAIARWRHKGVQAIPYSEEDSHSALWRSLEAWAERARDSARWQSKIIELSLQGPEALQPHERGQVAHIVSTSDGALKFCMSEPSPPSEWLCVFDPARRFAKPGYLGSFRTKGAYFDPFEAYGLDEDITPTKIDPEDHYTKREIPLVAWDAFKHNRLDLTPLDEENIAAFRGHWSSECPRLTPRIGHLGSWLAMVCNEPAAIWWASHQSSIHQDIRSRIEWRLNQLEPSQAHKAWRLLFEAWRRSPATADHQTYRLNREIEKYGWNRLSVGRLADAYRPYLSVMPSLWGGPRPPEKGAEVDELSVIRADVEYPVFHERVTVPSEWRSAALKALRQNLEISGDLEREIGGFGLGNISPIVADSEHGIDGFSRRHGISGAVIAYSDLFIELAAHSKSSAVAEYKAWDVQDEIFDRLRIWACGRKDIMSATDFEQLMLSLSDEAFWNSYHQRDLLITILNRWYDQGKSSKVALERRLLLSPPKWEREEYAEYDERNAWTVLSRVIWLVDKGCEFECNLKTEIETLRRRAPGWKHEYGEKAAASMESRGGFVRTVSDHQELLEVPLGQVISKALELSGRTDDFLVERNPFVGLVTKHPVRAFRALARRAKGDGDFPEWAWRSFLSAAKRKEDKARLTRQIALRLASYTEINLKGFVRPAADWLRDVARALCQIDTATFDQVLRKLVNVLRLFPSSGQSGVVRGAKTPDWTTEAINSASGRLAEAMFSDSRIENLGPGVGLPTVWANHMEALLSLDGDLGIYVSVLACHHLNWLYGIDPDWAERNLLPSLESKDLSAKSAAWAGFLWAATIPARNLYFRMKDMLLEAATQETVGLFPSDGIIASIILVGWASNDTSLGQSYISDDEMRSVLLRGGDQFRSRVLWQAERWTHEADPISKIDWQEIIPKLLKIWPRQVSTKSQNTSARLCLLVFSSGEFFEEASDLVLPLLVKINQAHLHLVDIDDDVIDRYASKVLAILYAILSDKQAAWPYGIEKTFKLISDADPSLAGDSRLAELKRIWDAR